MDKIKLIWDFRGINAEKTDQHHQKHLNEFTEREGLKSVTCGIEKRGEAYFIAFITVLNEDLIKVRDVLRPHRGELP